jgi:hypothetical protein
MNDSDFTSWHPPESAPTNGEPFLAELSNGQVTILWATWMVQRTGQRKARYAWWGGYSNGVRVPYTSSHPANTDWSTSPLLTGWQPLPKSRQRLAQEAEETSEPS